MLETVKKGGLTLSESKPKRVKVSKQRQISIPKEYYDRLNFEEEALIEISDSALIVRPAKVENVDLSEYILKDLVSEGYEGQRLIEKFKEMKEGIPAALDKMSAEALQNKPMEAGMSLDDFLAEVEDE